MWVKRVFIDPAEPGVPVVREINVFNPRTQQRETIRKYQVRIFGSYKENIFLPPEYIAELESITDENKREAWLHDKIGRASCRERVCQYVKISVVAGSLK